MDLVFQAFGGHRAQAVFFWFRSFGRQDPAQTSGVKISGAASGFLCPQKQAVSPTRSPIPVPDHKPPVLDTSLHCIAPPLSLTDPGAPIPPTGPPCCVAGGLQPARSVAPYVYLVPDCVACDGPARAAAPQAGDLHKHRRHRHGGPPQGWLGNAHCPPTDSNRMKDAEGKRTVDRGGGGGEDRRQQSKQFS